MKQTGNSINPDNIQHFADSAENAIAMGQRQFFTPPDLAKALMVPFGRLGTRCVVDLMHGSGQLLAASGIEHRFGIDVDARPPVHATGKAVRTYQADVTRWYPLAAAADFQADLYLLNPPFSLRWYLDRLGKLADSAAEGVVSAYMVARRMGTTIDSTPATLMIALDRLSRDGEGYMICNADTARRFLGDPVATVTTGLTADPRKLDEAHPFRALMRHVWAWVEIPGAVYEGQNSPFTTAVLYFSKSHGNFNDPRHREQRPPLFLHCPSADPDTVARTLATALTAAPGIRFGGRVGAEYQARKPELVGEIWEGIRGEYHALHHGARPSFNLRLDPAGRIATHLDPFRKHAYVHDRALLHALQQMHGQTPAGLVVQQVTRAALRHAVTCGAWRVDPALEEAVAAAVDAYEAVRAPFYKPNAVQALGWIDESSELACIRDGIPGIRKGDRLPLRTWIEETSWKDTRTSLAGEPENFESKGRELVVELTAADGTVHLFHVRRDDATADLDTAAASRSVQKPGEARQRHHDIRTLLDHFDIPIPRDIAESKPEAYAANLARLGVLESRMNSLSLPA